MSKAERQAEGETITSALKAAPNVYVTDFSGLDVAKMTEFRRRLRGAGAKYVVVKNTLAERALESQGITALTEHLKGPIGLVLSTEPLAAAKVLTEFAKEHQKPGIKAGLIDPWRENMKTLAGFDNVTCKISGAATEADHKAWTRDQPKPYVAHAIEVFGFDRSMYGGDWHVSELAIGYPEWVGLVAEVVAGASAAEKRQLFRDTAIRVYRLDA